MLDILLLGVSFLHWMHSTNKQTIMFRDDYDAAQAWMHGTNAAFQKLYVDVVVRWWSCVYLKVKKKKNERRDYWYYCVITVRRVNTESKWCVVISCLLLNMPCMQSIIQSCFCKIASCCTTQRNEEKKADGWMDYGQPHKQLQLPLLRLLPSSRILQGTFFSPFHFS